MTLVSEWATSHSPTGLSIYSISKDSWTSAYEHTSVGYIAVGDDGMLYTGTGAIFNGELTKIGNVPGRKLIPGIGGALYLGLSDDGSMEVFQSGALSPLSPIGKYPINGKVNDVLVDAWKKNTYTLDRHVVFDPLNGYVLLIPPENDRIVQRAFDLEKALKSNEIDYLVVRSRPEVNVAPGQTWSYDLDVISSRKPVKIAIESGPPGMEIISREGLAWNIPEDHPGGSEEVVVLIENEIEAQYHKFELRFSVKEADTSAIR